MLVIFLVLLFIVLSYFFIRPFVRTKEQRRKVLRLYIILVPLSFVFYWLITFFNYYSTPDSFKEGIKLLQNNIDVSNKIGFYESYSYREKDLPDKTDNPASFKVSFKGSLATIYLSCTISKDSTLGKWSFTKIVQDSLIKNVD